MVVQSRWKKRLIAGLALAGLTCGTTPLPRPLVAAAENADRLVTVADHGKPGQKCRVLRSWRMPDGGQAYEVQSLETSEFMTVVESGPPTTLPGPRPGTRVQVRSTKIYHWGRHDTPPPGAPVPPGSVESSAARTQPEPGRTASTPPRRSTAGQPGRSASERPMPERGADQPELPPRRVQPVDPVLNKLTEIEKRLREIESRPPVVLQAPPPPPVVIREPAPSPTPGRAAIIQVPDRPLLPVDHGPAPTPPVIQNHVSPAHPAPDAPRVRSPRWEPVPDSVSSPPVIRVEDRQPRILTPPPAPMPPELPPPVMPAPVRMPVSSEPALPHPEIIEIRSPAVAEQPAVHPMPIEPPTQRPAVPGVSPSVSEPRTVPTPELPPALPGVEMPVAPPTVVEPSAPRKLGPPAAPPKGEPASTPPKTETIPTPPATSPRVEPPPVPPMIEQPTEPPKVETPAVPPMVEPPPEPPKVANPTAPPKVEDRPTPVRVETPPPAPTPPPMPVEPPAVVQPSPPMPETVPTPGVKPALPPTIVVPTPVKPLTPQAVDQLPTPEPSIPRIETPPPAVQAPPMKVATMVEQHLTGLRDGMLPSERERAAEALLSVDVKQHPHLIQALVTAAKTDPAATVRVCCLRGLVKLNANTPPVLSLVKELEKDRDIRVSSEAQWARRQFGGQK